MARFRLLVLAGLLVALFAAGSGFAQTVTNLSIISGNGQMICYGCSGFPMQIFEPLMVMATDANGAPVSGATITWTVIYGQALINGSTITAADGTSTNTPLVQVTSGSGTYLQTTIGASAGTPSVLFTLNQALPSAPNNFPQVQVSPPSVAGALLYNSPALSGQSGTRGANPIIVTISNSPFPGAGGIPGVSVRLVNAQSSPASTIACVSQAGADPGSVLTDNTGTASCTPVFGGAAGAGSYYVLVGGVPRSQTNSLIGPNGEIGFAEYGSSGGPLSFTVTASTPGMIQIVNGNGQSANPGQSLPLALVAKVADSSGNALSGQNVTFTVTPSTAGTLSNISSTSDSNGQVSANLSLSSSAAGAVQVTVAIAGNSSISATFTETANVQISGLQKNSGDQQSAPLSTAFSQPLVVTVNGSTGQPLGNYPVQFAVTAGSATLSAGSATLSAVSATTGSNGQAQVTVTAGATTGSVTVTATAGSYSQTFSLTVTAAGPLVTASSFYNGAGFQQGSLSPCGIAAIIAPGIAPGIQGIAGSQIIGQLPTQMVLGTAGTVVSVSFSGTLAPIFSASNVNGQQQLTVQVPCEVTPGASVPVVVTVGGASANVNVAVQPASPGIFTTVMSDGVARAVMTRPDGTFVSTANPARVGETTRLYATGLGPTAPALSTNDAFPPSGSDALVQGSVIVGYGNASGGGSGTRAISARALPGLIGVFEVVFQLPSDSATGNNVTLSMGVAPPGSTTMYGSNTTKMSVE